METGSEKTKEASSVAKTSAVRVGVRVRPFTAKEISASRSSGSVLTCIRDVTQEIRLGSRRFTYDAVFDETVSQEALYRSVAGPLMGNFLEGFNATIMAYGQTGSGKTYTMGSEAHEDMEISPQTGIIPRFMRDLFANLETRKEASSSSESSGHILVDYKLTASFLEVYGEDVHDLLVPSRPCVPVREDGNGGVVCAGLTEFPISTADDALHVLHEGTMHRTTAATLMNLTSSRSHAVFTVTLTQKTVVRTSRETTTSSTVSRLTFVDLAGSERMKKTGAEGERAREGIKINEGLLALGNVINALADQKKIDEGKKVHVPYRQSKLTRLLQDALGGNSQTLFLACVSPADTNASETLSTLHYANRARNIRNAPVQNVDSGLQELRRLRVWSEILQNELLRHKFAPEEESQEPGKIKDEILVRGDVQEYLQELQSLVAQGSTNTKSIHIGLGSASGLPNNQNLARSFFSPTTAKSSDPMDVDGGLNQSVMESFDPNLLSEVNPDHEMAILNQLLELQHRDQAFDDEQKQDNAALEKVEGELAEQESMLLQIRDSLKVYHSIKNKYEILVAEVQQLESEKAQLAAQLEKATADPTQGCSSAIQRQLDKVEKSLARARIETQKHRDQYRKLEREQQKCQVLERKISELKNGRAAMIKKQKDAAARHREYTEAKTRELVALKRKERNAEKKVSKLQTEVQIHKRNLEKRQQFIQKLNDKLKQTELHLMKLLSTRQRNLKDRMSSIHNRSSIAYRSSILSMDNEGFQAASSSEVKSSRFLIDRFVTEKVSHYQLGEEYQRRVREYTAAMKDMVDAVEGLRQLRTEAEPDPQTLSDALQAVEDAELKVELVSTDVENLRSQMNNQESLSTMQKNLSKIIESQPVNVLRTLLIGLLDKMVSSEQKRCQSEAVLRKKERTVESLESEIDLLNRKVAAFANESAKRQEVAAKEENNEEKVVELKEEKVILTSKLEAKDRETKEYKERIFQLQSSLSRASADTEKAQQRAAALKVAGDGERHAERALEILSQIQEVWNEMGISLETDQHVVESIENCLEDTCERKLQEAKTKKDDMIKSILEVRQAVSLMERNLGLSATIPDKFSNLNEEKLYFEGIHKTILPKFEAAISQSKDISIAAQCIQKAMGLDDSELPKSLYRLVRDEKAASQERNMNPTFLSVCEEELSNLRVQKSEIMVQNSAKQSEVSEALLQMNVPESSTYSFVQKAIENHADELPEWWDNQVVVDICRIIPNEPSLPRATKAFKNHLQVVHQAVLSEAAAYRSLSEGLQALIERAQQTLLKTVEGGHDAVEACASFRNALLRLPRLSKERIDTCLSQIRELIPGVDAMIQSEIEALTVVWEALGTPTTDRGKFWESIDMHLEKSESDVFMDVIQLKLDRAGWLSRTARQGQKEYASLDKKLYKLEAVHREVETLRARQDAKSKVLSLDSEVRLLNAQLLEFEEKKCSKDRLLSRQTASSNLLREERYRKQMKAKFSSKLEQLSELLKVWNEKNSTDFDPNILSEDVRMLLQNNSWINERKEFMHLRTTKSKRSGKRRIDRTGSSDGDESISPPSKRSNTAIQPKATHSSTRKVVQPKKAPSSSAAVKPAARPVESKANRSATSKRKAVNSSPSMKHQKKRKTTPTATDSDVAYPKTTKNSLLSPQNTNIPKTREAKQVGGSKRMTLPPFGHVLEEAQTPTDKAE